MTASKSVQHVIVNTYYMKELQYLHKSVNKKNRKGIIKRNDTFIKRGIIYANMKIQKHDFLYSMEHKRRI